MKKGQLIRLSICIVTFSLLLYQAMVGQNKIVRLRLEIPKLQQQLADLQAENKRLLFEIETFENPLSLLELARQPRYSHLKHPINSDIIIIPIS